MSKSIDLKYQLLADELEDAILQGRLAIGSRLQSVRKLMAQRAVSLATVLSAYRTLEERGLVVARPKSGYFVVGNGDERSRGTKSPDASTGSAPLSPAESANSPDPDLLPTQRLHRLTASMVRRNPHLSTRHPDRLGLSKLRREIASRSADIGSFIRAAELVITNGATEALILAIRAVAQPGDCVALQAPANPKFLALLAGLHVRVVELAVEPTSGISQQALEQAIASHPGLRACLVVPNFHHPTGVLMPVARKRDFVALAEGKNLAVIEVDIYGELQHEGTRPPPLKAFDTNGTVIYLTSYSNTVGPGLNVGWIAAGRWQAQIEAGKHALAVATAELPQLVLYEFLSRGSHIPHYRRLRHLLRERTLRVDAALKRGLSSTCQWSIPDGGYFLWLELPEDINAARLLSQPGLEQPSLSPGQLFSAQNSYGHCLRINTSLADPATVSMLARAVGKASTSGA